MIKFLFFCLMFFLLSGLFTAVARDQQDTTVAIGQDTVLISEHDSATKVEEPDDSLYMPVPDSMFSNIRIVRSVSENQTSRYKNNPEYAYANDSEYWRKEPMEEPGLIFRILNSQVLRWIFLALVGGLILYGVYQLAVENNFTMLIRTGRQKTDDTLAGVSDEKIDFDESIRLCQ